MARLDGNIAGRAQQDSIRVLRQSQVTMHARPPNADGPIQMDQADNANRTGFRGILSRASNHSKGSRGSAGDESPDHGRPTHDNPVRRSSQLAPSALKQGETQWQSTRKAREKI